MRYGNNTDLITIIFTGVSFFFLLRKINNNIKLLLQLYSFIIFNSPFCSSLGSTVAASSELVTSSSFAVLTDNDSVEVLGKKCADRNNQKDNV